ncbi:exodeoxyribonuclease VII large subunit [Veillonella caviae]|uniref:exodeoxyribonuclease VII large subunit n=1 Tax=Veillonella caviae TaxID=248316 RepID=UPI0023A87E42|nr:exodeoxyribonuclease VII large subunit [Veillonella caviae]MCI5708146.1 exodeoxyribonuclease VII large subunit [Veillonella caviae]MDD7291601.1 exodeoxyribonuclease VII large subunit [Veillonella caviae]MDY5715406.1 exodeoxyribonuclease VII large subunit [Veillonella caviae]MDY5786695.1 exodeoxyribonuclease VII large subunit [Veillonella caviae]
MNVLTISQLNSLIKRTLEREYLLKNLYVTGTIINAKRHSSGHVYFSLKDEESSIDVTMWSNTVLAKGLVNEIQNGLLVTIKASVNFYNKMGRLNLVASDMQIGNKSPLQLEFDALQKELSALGYFDETHKQMIPVLSSCIGIVTSPSGAVLHDILHVSKQRNPLMKFKLFSVPVQGPDAGPIIAKGIAEADRDSDIDVIIVGRGGGSMEDLWCFNDRAVVEAIYTANTPIISAVGHETDYTLADYAADMRGATPSHAAEMAVIPLTTLQEDLQKKEEYIHYVMNQVLQQKRSELSTIFNRKLGIPALQMIHKQKSALENIKNTLQHKSSTLIQHKKHVLSLIAKELDMQNPLHIMMKGYSKVESHNHPISSVLDVQVGDELTITVSDGNISAQATSIYHKPNDINSHS